MLIISGKAPHIYAFKITTFGCKHVDEYVVKVVKNFNILCVIFNDYFTQKARKAQKLYNALMRHAKRIIKIFETNLNNVNNLAHEFVNSQDFCGITFAFPNFYVSLQMHCGIN